VPSANGVLCVNDAVELEPAVTPLPKSLACDHSRLYGVPANATASVLAVHVHVGVVSLVGVGVFGVPGSVGAVVSITTCPFDE